MRRYDVDETDEGNERDAADPHEDLLARAHRLHESHFRPVPDARQMLLTVRMGYELNITSSYIDVADSWDGLRTIHNFVHLLTILTLSTDFDVSLLQDLTRLISRAKTYGN